jgi:hypothetical protein
LIPFSDGRNAVFAWQRSDLVQSADLRRPEHDSDEQIARLIDWHTPEIQAAYRPRHCASPSMEDSRRPVPDAQPERRATKSQWRPGRS